MSENHPTRRDVLISLAGLPLLASTLKAEAGAPSVCFMSAVEMARLIRAKKLSAREALAMHLTQIERVNPKVNAIVTLVPELAASARRADLRSTRKRPHGGRHRRRADAARWRNHDRQDQHTGVRFRLADVQ